MIPTVLRKIEGHLKNYDLKLSHGDDARIDSARSETAVISALQNTLTEDWKIITHNIKHNRHWYDFLCIDNISKDRFYVDVKISNCRSSDNMNAKKAIYWLLTGDDNTGKVPDQNSQFFKLLREKENLDKRDFYYLIVNKTDLKDIFMVSLRNINSRGVTGSHNNPPLQARWEHCKTFEQRSMLEAKEFFLSKWAEVVSKNIQVLQAGMPAHYPEYFGV